MSDDNGKSKCLPIIINILPDCHQRSERYGVGGPDTESKTFVL